MNPPVASPVLGERITAFRKDASLTQPELAARAGVSISTVYRAERSDPSIGPRMVARIAAALSAEVREIYVGTVVAVAGQPVTAHRAEEQHLEVIRRLDAIQSSLDEVRSRSYGPCRTLPA